MDPFLWAWLLIRVGLSHWPTWLSFSLFTVESQKRRDTQCALHTQLALARCGDFAVTLCIEYAHHTVRHSDLLF